MTATPTRSTAAVWRPATPWASVGSPSIGDLALERGGVLPDVTVAYETWGTLSPSGDNAVLVEHALTGDSHVVGDAGPGHPSPGWWPGLIGPGRAARHRPALRRGEQRARWLPGHDGPASAAPDGPALGRALPLHHDPRPGRRRGGARRRPGHRAVARRPGRLDGRDAGAGVGRGRTPSGSSGRWSLASTAYATADQVAWCQPQLLAIRCDPAYRGGDYYGTDDWPVTGMGIARRIAHTTYRQRGRARRALRPPAPGGEDPLGGGGRYDVESYLDHHAAKLARRFDPNSYVVLTEAMNSHDVGRGRGGVARRAGRAFDGHLHVAGVDYRPALPAAAVRGDRGRRGRAPGSRSSSPVTATTASSSRPTRSAPSSTRVAERRLTAVLHCGTVRTSDTGPSVLRRRS